MRTFDVAVIGGGPGGYVCAIKAAQLGKKVALIEKKDLGGICLNLGCIPSKALLRNADLVYTMRAHASEYGIRFDNLNCDYAEAFKRSRQVSQRLTKGIAFLMKKNGVELIYGQAAFSGKHSLELSLADGNSETVKAKDIVIATGSHASVIPGWEPDGVKIFDFRHAILAEKLPQSAVIIGGGAIGAELATVWSSYGVKVDMVEMLPHILPNEDEEAAAELAKAFKKRGVKIYAGTKVKNVLKTEEGTRVLLEGPAGEETLEAEVTLVAVGFRPNSADLGLEKIGLELDKRGYIVIDQSMRTNVPGVWAIGDVTGKLLLAHTASAMGMLCAKVIAGQKTQAIDYRMIPRAVYTTPQVASFGYSEMQAKEAGFELKTGKFPFMANGKALGLNEYSGYAKIIANAKTNRLLGASIVGPEASELLPELTLAASNALGVEAVAENIHAHPTLSEVLMEAAEAVDGKAIHA
ncbi:MAG: dihydrolipoyl dehydrogenase [Anaerolineaceae bacterium]|nr:dihydrolipoyl dehydrogenase [Anaerolineaceae bacterium]